MMRVEKDRIVNRRIAVVGAGGVGGYLAGMLGQVCPHLTLAVRGERRRSILENGLVLHSEHRGEVTVRPERVVATEEMGVQDVIFVCVKNYSLEEACREMAHAVTEDTVIIPVMNGVDPGQRIRKLIGRGTVVDSLIYIVAFSNADYSVTQQGDYADLRIGITNADEEGRKKVTEVSELLDAAMVDHVVAEDIEREIWRKYILNCAYNVATACYDNTIGELRADPVKSKEYESLVEEAYEVARAKGVRVKPEHRDEIIRRFYEKLADDATSSLQRDIRAGKQAETDTFSGYIVREGKRLGVDVPVSERMYGRLLAKERDHEDVKKSGENSGENCRDNCGENRGPVCLISGGEKPSADLWLKEAKEAPGAPGCGMYLLHNGVVRESPRAEVREGAADAGTVKEMEFSFDAGAAEDAAQRAARMPGIFSVRVWMNEGRLEVGEDIMMVLVGGDTRPHVIEALETLVGELKRNCVREREILE